MYYIRFTENIEDDLKRGTSILTNHNNLIVDGLCVFYGETDIESTMKKALLYGKSVANDGDTFVILKGVESKGPSGTLGTVIENIEMVSIHALELD